LTPEQKAAEKEERNERIKHQEGSNGALIDDFFKKLLAGRDKWITCENMYFMNILAVRPEYQRKGLGGMLLEPVLALADQEGRRTYIEASKKGLGLYLKYGWVKVDEFTIDTTPYGGDTAEETTVLLIREPRPVKA